MLQTLEAMTDSGEEKRQVLEKMMENFLGGSMMARVRQKLNDLTPKSLLHPSAHGEEKKFFHEVMSFFFASAFLKSKPTNGIDPRQKRLSQLL